MSSRALQCFGIGIKLLLLFLDRLRKGLGRLRSLVLNLFELLALVGHLLGGLAARVQLLGQVRNGLVQPADRGDQRGLEISHLLKLLVKVDKLLEGLLGSNVDF